MRESFVFHSEYIDDLPQSAKSKFTQYIVDYGLYGKEPSIEKETFEYTTWIKIKKRIDTETEKYKTVSEKRKAAAQKRYEKYNETEESNTKKSENKEFTKTTQTNDFVNQSEKNNQSEKPKRKNFVKPTVEEIAEYCKERKNNLNANSIWDFYEAKGWMIGKDKMKDWKACVRTWENHKKTESSGGHTKGLIGNENEVSQDYLDLM